jgi:hypothetical protein
MSLANQIIRVNTKLNLRVGDRIALSALKRRREDDTAGTEKQEAKIKNINLLV